MFKPTEVTYYKCGNPDCNRSSVFTNMGNAEQCCVCSTCGKKIDHNYGNRQCNKCMTAASDNRRWEKMGNAELVPYEEGMVLHDNDDKFFYDDDGLYCHFTDDYDSLEDLPEYMYVATKIVGVTLDAYSTVERSVEDRHYEDAMENVEFLGSLQHCLDVWCERQDIVSYAPDNTKKISVKDWIKANNITFDFEEE